MTRLQSGLGLVLILTPNPKPKPNPNPNPKPNSKIQDNPKSYDNWHLRIILNLESEDMLTIQTRVHEAQARRLGLELAIASFAAAITESYLSPVIVTFNLWLSFDTDDSGVGLAIVKLAMVSRYRLQYILGDC